jgi:outer membrane protein OmpA-like peptidoglycan-associated protein
MSRTPILALLFATFTLTTAAPAHAQFGDMLKKKAKERLDKKTEKEMDKALDKVECAATDSKCIEKGKADGKTVVTEDGTVVSKPGDAAAKSDSAPAAAFVNFDFVPGDKVLFAEDFASDNVGDFPRHLEFGEGNMEVADYMGRRWLRATTRSSFSIDLPDTLPERFTLEFDHIGKSWSFPHVSIRFDGAAEDARQVDRVTIETWAGGDNVSDGGIFAGDGTKRSVGTVSGDGMQNKPFTVRVMVDGKYAKVYMAGTRVANIPNANLGRSDKIIFFVDAKEDRPAYFSNFRVAAGGKDLYDALSEKGRVATQGIYFATGSDALRPESAPTLEEIAKMLKEHSDLKLTIEGHTDNVGAAAANQSLSEKRAAAVKAALVSKYGVDAARLETAGFGATKPAASNDTPEGRQSNRRVELVKG